MLSKKSNLIKFLISWRGYLLLLILVVGLWISLKMLKSQKRVNISNRILNKLNSLPWYGTEMKKIIISQAAHETGNFTSFIFISNNNLFGMRQPEKRNTTSLGKKNNYASFKDIESCIEDFNIYLEYVSLSKNYYSIKGYCEALKRKKYFEDSTENYIKGVTYFYNLYFK